MIRDRARAQRDLYRMQIRAGRRGSVLGPIFVLSLGVIFLLVELGRLPASRLWVALGRWWPLLLVLAGVVLLAEWAFDQWGPGDPQRRYGRRSAGGVVALIILLALGGASIRDIHDFRDLPARGFSINPDNMAEFFGTRHESDETLDSRLPTGAALTIDDPHGDVTVTGASTDGLIHMVVHKQVYASTDAGAEAEARELAPAVTSSPTLVKVTVPSRGGASADLLITLPASAPVTINANHGDVKAQGLNAPLTVTANHGDVTLSEIGAAVTAHVNNNGSSISAHRVTGPVTMEGHAEDMTFSEIGGNVAIHGDYYGTTHLEHIGGSVRFKTSKTDFQLARLDGEIDISSDGIEVDRAAGPVDITTRNRNLKLEHVSGEVTVTNRNGAVEVTSALPLGNVTVQNRSGSVTLNLPEKAAFAVHAETTDGSIENDFSLPQASGTEGGSSLTGTVGKGGPVLRIDNNHGDIAIRKTSISATIPVAPEPPHLPAISARGEDGSSVSVGKDGLRIFSGGDGASVVLGKDGMRISEGADGDRVFRAKDGTTLVRGADGALSYTERNGTHYAKGADGSRTLTAPDGTRIVVSASGERMASGPGGRVLSESQSEERMGRVEEAIRRMERRQREAEPIAGKIY
jgi:DUF4097 and DUF4098 domain-containing protein YvlB